MSFVKAVRFVERRRVTGCSKLTWSGDADLGIGVGCGIAILEVVVDGMEKMLVVGSGRRKEGRSE